MENNGPFIVCWKRSVASLDVMINPLQPALFAQDLDALYRLLDAKIEGVIMRHFIQSAAPGTSEVLPSSATGGISYTKNSPDFTPDLSYEDSLIELCVITFGNLVRVLTPNSESVLVDAFKPMQKLPKIYQKWTRIDNSATNVSSYKSIQISKKTMIQQIMSRAKPNSVMKLIVERCRVVAARLRPLQ